MRMFEAAESPVKHVSELAKSLSTTSFEEQRPLFSQLKPLQSRNLLKSRKTCERKRIDIAQLAAVD